MERIQTSTERIAARVGAGACLLLMAVTLVDVAGRPLGLHISVMNELGVYAGALVLFLPLGEVTRMGGHLRADFFESFFAPSFQKALRKYLINVLNFAYSAILLYIVVDITRSSLQYGVRTPTLLSIPIGIPQIVMVTGIFILTIRFGLILLGDILGGRSRDQVVDGDSSERRRPLE